MKVTVANSMAYRMCLVASGAADATIAFTPKSDWDVAAASLIATEAGAVVSDIRGKTRKAWKAAAQRTVDNAHMRYFILHAHDLLDPDGDGVIG